MNKLLIPFILFSSFAFSQSNELSKGLGFSGGMISGTGFSYRQMGDKNGFQITGGLVAFNVDDEEEYFEAEIEYPKQIIADDQRPFQDTFRGGGNTKLWTNIGVTYYKPFHRAKKSMFYGLVGASTYFNSQVYYIAEYAQSSTTDTTVVYKKTKVKKETENEFDFFGGLGIGIEYKLTNNIRIHLEIPITISHEGDIWTYIPQGGLHYYFK